LEFNDNLRTRSIAPAIGLFFLSPLIGEFLLGNISIDEIVYGFALAPLYGGGALLIREVARRNERGWPTIALLGVAYSLVEEGLADQMLFNPAYDNAHMLEKAYIPSWGTGASVILESISVHAIWSICVSIAMVESLSPRRSTTPWLGKLGLTITAVVFAAGVVLVTYGNYQEYHFVASPTQLTVTTFVVIVIVGIAFAIGRQPRKTVAVNAPNPWLVGAVSFVASSFLMGVIFDLSPWIGVVAWFVLVAAFVAVVLRWSQAKDWGAAHRLALAGGALLTYAWVGFTQEPASGSKGAIHLIGNILFAIGALALLAVAVRHVRKAVIAGQ
jgi:hypothetical protein